MPVVIKVSHLFLKTVTGMFPLKTELTQTTYSTTLWCQHRSTIFGSPPVSILSATWFIV